MVIEKLSSFGVFNYPESLESQQFDLRFGSIAPSAIDFVEILNDLRVDWYERIDEILVNVDAGALKDVHKFDSVFFGVYADGRLLAIFDRNEYVCFIFANSRESQVLGQNLNYLQSETEDFKHFCRFAVENPDFYDSKLFSQFLTIL